jgi:hypothetical protein
MLCLFGHPADETDRAFSIFLSRRRLWRPLKPNFA